MMKKTLLLFICAISLIACQKNPSISVAPSELTFDATGGTLQVTVSANYDWKATASNQAVNISPASGSGDMTISVTMPENLTGSPIFADITFVCSGNGGTANANASIIQNTVIPNIEIISMDPEDKTVSSAGGNVVCKFTTNYPWTATHDDGISLDKLLGNAGESVLTITVPATTSSEEKKFRFTIEITIASGESETIGIDIIQKPLPLPSLKLAGDEKNFDFAGGDQVYTLTANFPWTSSCDEGVIIKPESGDAGDTEVTISFPANKGKEDISYAYSFHCTNGDIVLDQTQNAIIPRPSLIYGGVTYKVEYMKDGRFWMTDNLRFLPEGITPSSDPTAEAGIWYPNAQTTEAKTDDESIAKFGYLYSTMIACKIDEITAENYQSFEGCQGICPDGWHIPTEAESQALIDAYYDETQKGALISSLEADGFSCVLGGFRMKNTSTQGASYSAAMPGYIMGSTGKSYTVNSTTGAITSRNRAKMVTNNTKFQRVTIADLSNYGGCTVRCVRNESAE